MLKVNLSFEGISNAVRVQQTIDRRHCRVREVGAEPAKGTDSESDREVVTEPWSSLITISTFS